jgi:DNA-binding NarL/FixJ family response regulator
MKTYNIIIVDSKTKYRKDIKEYLEMQFNCSIIAEASNGESFLRLGEIIDRADAVLMDIGVIKNSGQLLVQRLMVQYPKTKIITIVNPEDYYYLVSLMFLNIREIVYKSMFFYDVIPALKRVLNGETMKREVTVSEMSSILFN